MIRLNNSSYPANDTHLEAMDKAKQQRLLSHDSNVVFMELMQGEVP